MHNLHNRSLQQSTPRWLHGMVPIAAVGFVILMSNTYLTAVAAQRVAPPSDSPYRLAANVRQVMTALTIPASDVIFQAAAEPPKAGDGWDTVQKNALLLAESGNLLMLPGRGPDREEWVTQSRGLIDAAMLAFDAAAARNADQLAEAGDKIYATCDSCHNKYMAK
jgi:hypothetical protein